MTPGTFIRLPDGREGTIVYHGLDGYGGVWERQVIDVEAILSGNPITGEKRPANVPEPEFMLRSSYPSADIECVGESYEIVE